MKAVYFFAGLGLTYLLVWLFPPGHH